jgi:hypothetical protein
MLGLQADGAFEELLPRRALAFDLVAEQGAQKTGDR